MTRSEPKRWVKAAMIVPTLLGCALLLGRGAAQLASRGLVTDAKSALVTRSEPLPSARTLAEAVLARNVFDSQTGALTWQEADSAPPQLANELPEIDGEPPVCDGSMRLVGAMVVPHEPELSFVSIADGAATHLYHTGMQVGDREVVGIREQRVFLRSSSASTCQLGMFAPAQSQPAAPTAQPSVSSDITRTGENSFRVARSLFQQAVSGGGLGTVRVVPHRENGQPAGLKLAGVRRGSVTAQLGLESGDVLRSINGHDLSEPDRALAAYAELRTAERFTLIVVRGGKPRTVQYTVE